MLKTEELSKPGFLNYLETATLGLLGLPQNTQSGQ